MLPVLTKQADEQYIGSLLKWRLLDPIGGMVLSMYIIIEWIKTLLENFAKRELMQPHILFRT